MASGRKKRAHQPRANQKPFYKEEEGEGQKQRRESVNTDRGKGERVRT